MQDEPWLAADYHGDIFLDVGANCGHWSLQLAHRFQRIYAFEPQPELAAQLCEAFLAADLPGIVYPFALGHQHAVRELYCVATRSTVASFTRREDLRDSVVRRVITLPLDELSSAWPGSIDFVKVDVEGAELEVLQGAERTLAKYVPTLLVEIHNQELGAAVADYMTGLYGHWELIRHPYYTPESAAWQQHYWLRARREGATQR